MWKYLNKLLSWLRINLNQSETTAETEKFGNTVTAQPIAPFIYTSPIPTITPSISGSNFQLPVLVNTSDTVFVSTDTNGKFILKNANSVLSPYFLYKPGIAGGQTIYGGVNASDNLYLYASNHLAPGTIFLGGSTKDTSLAVDAGGYVQLKSLGIGVAPDPINFGLYIKNPITAGIKFEAGTGYALLFLARAGVNIGYWGLGSLTNNSVQFSSYADRQAAVILGSSGIPQIYCDHNTNGSHLYSQFSSSNHFFSIGLNPDSETPIAKLHIKDGRDGSTDRIGVLFDTTAASWTNLSKLQEWRLGGVSKALIGVNGTFCQIKPAVFTTTAGVEYVVSLLTLSANRRYKFTVKAIGKQSGDAGDLEAEVQNAFYRYTTGGAVARCATKAIIFCSTDPTDYIELDTSGNDVVAKIKTSVAMTIQLYVIYEINTV